MQRKFRYQALMMGLALLLVPALGQTQTLEEILKEKGVITSEEYEAVMKEQSLTAYQPGKGLTAATADGNYRLQIGGYAQLIYRYTDYDSQSADDKSDFDIRRFKLQLQGNLFSKKFGYKYQGDISSGFVTEDAYINYKFATPLTVQFGQFKPPQSRQELTSASRQLFVERSLANDTFNLGRDQGLQAAGTFADKLIEYRLGLFNGNGPNISNPNNRHMVAGRLDLNPLGEVKMDEAGWTSDKPLLNIGSSFAWNKVGANDVGSQFDKDNDVMDVALNLDQFTTPTAFTAAYGNDLTSLLWTANANATWQGATFAAEYYNLKASPDLGDDWDADGYYLQAAYQVIPKTVEVAARYSAIKCDDQNASSNFDKDETQFGINYYFDKHNLKLQADYTMIEDHWNLDKDDQVARLQLQFVY